MKRDKRQKGTTDNRTRIFCVQYGQERQYYKFLSTLLSYPSVIIFNIAVLVYIYNSNPHLPMGSPSCITITPSSNPDILMQ